MIRGTLAAILAVLAIYGVVLAFETFDPRPQCSVAQIHLDSDRRRCAP